VNANSKVDLRRKPPNIMKLCRLRYWGCIIWTLWRMVSFILRIVDLSSVLVILFDSEDEEEVDVGTVAVVEVG